jgi:hypothetical protein
MAKKKDLEEQQRSAKALKKRAKQQIKAQKKDKKASKKKNKAERKYQKAEAKLRRKGIYPMDAASEEEGEIIEAEEFVPTEWVRKSTEDIPFVEKKIDLMAERRDQSSLHQLFEEKYGESLSIPETYKEYELSDAEKRRLEAIRAMAEEAEAPVETAPVQAEVAAQEEEAETEIKEKAARETKPIWNPWQLYIYFRWGQDRMIILKIIILLVSIILWVFSFPFRFVIWLILTIVGKIKSRRAEKAAAET